MRSARSLATLVLASLPSAAIAAGPPADFTEDVKLLSRVVACNGDSPLPPHIDAKVVAEHCADLKKKMARYQSLWVESGKPFIAKIRGDDVPKTVVYPFGGGDLLSALTTYPDATEITTMSLEHAGDPRRIRTITKKSLEESLRLLRRTLIGLLYYDDSTTENLMKGQRFDIPGQLAFFLVALEVHGFEPVGLRYFHLTPDGTIEYETDESVTAAEPKKAKLLRSVWVSPDFSEAFSNAELTFVKKGDTAQRIHRHMAADLSDKGLEQHPGLLKHLEAKGRISAMTKAASYLLWRDDFSKIRNYLLDHMEIMISDSTGIPPKFAKAAGFTQETYGNFEASFLGANAAHNKDFKELWATQPKRILPFRYGYIDSKKQVHMLVTRKAPKT